MKKLVCWEIFAWVEVIKTFVKTKEHGDIIYKMVNAWLRNCKSIPCLYEKGNKGYKEREIGNKMLGEELSNFHSWRFTTFAKNFIIQITCNVIPYHLLVSPAINYGEFLFYFFFFFNISRTHVFFSFLLICSWVLEKTTTAPLHLMNPF